MKASLFLIAVLLSGPAWAQLHKGTTNVIAQQDAEVGFVWVEGTNDPCRYTEYWFLGPAYVYPNTPGVYAELNVRPDGNGLEFDTPREFFDYARSVFPGGKRVIADVTELEHCGPGGQQVISTQLELTHSTK